MRFSRRCAHSHWRPLFSHEALNVGEYRARNSSRCVRAFIQSTRLIRCIFLALQHRSSFGPFPCRHPVSVRKEQIYRRCLQTRPHRDCEVTETECSFRVWVSLFSARWPPSTKAAPLSHFSSLQSSENETSEPRSFPQHSDLLVFHMWESAPLITLSGSILLSGSQWKAMCVRCWSCAHTGNLLAPKAGLRPDSLVGPLCRSSCLPRFHIYLLPVTSEKETVKSRSSLSDYFAPT